MTQKHRRLTAQEAAEITYLIAGSLLASCFGVTLSVITWAAMQ